MTIQFARWLGAVLVCIAGCQQSRQDQPSDQPRSKNSTLPSLELIRVTNGPTWSTATVRIHNATSTRKTIVGLECAFFLSGALAGTSATVATNVEAGSRVFADVETRSGIAADSADCRVTYAHQ